IDDPAASCWSPAERAVLELASAMALTSPRGTLTEDNYRRLREHFDDAQIVELGMTMAVLTGMAKFLFAFDLVEREEYCEFGVSTEGS
ncbi:MAG: carboxymuconolactone decarboxylase family protein, partial [Gammaproteobacteria bacterium]|nr:carboxymuconolactone decarboxylase family protein [Gammaproteobacteria bacterium]